MLIIELLYYLKDTNSFDLSLKTVMLLYQLLDLAWGGSQLKMYLLRFAQNLTSVNIKIMNVQRMQLK